MAGGTCRFSMPVHELLRSEALSRAEESFSEFEGGDDAEG
jgi:hypothetical protein